jgi:hypothetical protein
MTSTKIGRQAVAEGFATQAEVDDIAAGWRAWAAHPDAWFGVPHGEIICRV